MIVEPVGVTKPTSQISPVFETKTTAGVPKASCEKKEKDDVEFLRDMLGVAQNHFHVSGVGLSFSVHEATGRIKVDVTDKETGKLIREIPPEQVLNLMAKIDEMMGILYDKIA